MSLPLSFHPEVQAEVDDAYKWYERQRHGLGDDFLAEIEKVFDRLCATPAIHQLVYQDVRRALPKRFPFSVFYRILTDRVDVIAVQHSRRDPAGWQSRVPPTA